MPEFIVQYTATEITREEVIIEAETEEEALRTVEEYEFDNSASNFIASNKWEVSDAEVVRRVLEDKKD